MRATLILLTASVSLLATTCTRRALAQQPTSMPTIEPAASGGDTVADDAPQPAALAPGVVRLKWGRQAPLFHTPGAGDAHANEPISVAPINIRQKTRTWAIRVGLPRFIVLGYPEESASLGTEQSLQLLLGDGSHVISLTGEWSFGEGDAHCFGGGIGYAYELELMHNIMYLELGGTLGMHSVRQEGSDHNSYSGEGDDPYAISVVMLTPMFHIGYKWAFFSIGPRMGFGSTIVGGLAVGFSVTI